jgi:hypothetical protein
MLCCAAEWHRNQHGRCWPTPDRGQGLRPADAVGRASEILCVSGAIPFGYGHRTRVQMRRSARGRRGAVEVVKEFAVND